jgi:predicted O-methyltransferase YrrM
MKGDTFNNMITIKIESNPKNIIKLFFIILIFVLLLNLEKKCLNYNKINYNNNYGLHFDKFEVNIFNKIKDSLAKAKCSRMWANQRQFLNGAVRKFKPKRVLELGVAEGGSSIIILNAIQDIDNSHLFSIDLSSHYKIGSCVKNFFPHFLNKWSLYTGNVAAKFIEEIGDNIDMVFIDSGHYEPGEILDFLIVLPFLKEGALVGFHDIGNQITTAGAPHSRNEWAPYIIFNILRGKKYLPSGEDKILTHDIGFVELEKNQFLYYHDYFRALGGQWQYFPDENDITLIRELFKKYYDKECLIMFDETVKFNRKFVKNNPLKTNYKFDSISLYNEKRFIKN